MIGYLPAYGWFLTAMVGVQLLLSLWLNLGLSRRVGPTRRSRRVSVLVAARNEETNILACLQSLEAQDYPKTHFEVLVGDDDSDDETANIVKAFAKGRPWVHYHHITENLPGLKGKQNVLAQLAHHASGEVYLITDADITHQPAWAAHLVGGLDEDDGPVALVSGPTVVKGRSLLANLQTLDWLQGMAIVKALDGWRLPLTAVGNNMGVTAKAYWAIGGYKAVPFSLTEDYKLFAELTRWGYRQRWLFHPGVLNRSEPQPDPLKLIHQRRRWFRGGSEGPRYALALFAFNATVHPALMVGLLLMPPNWVLALMGVKALSDGLLLLRGAQVLGGVPHTLAWWLPHQAYQLVAATFGPLALLATGRRVNWKGRRY